MKQEVMAMLSNRHVHLLPEHVEALFGAGKTLTPTRYLVDPEIAGERAEYAAEEVVALEGPKGRIEGVRVLGPARRYTQVEILRSDAYKLGINPPVRDSGNLADAAPIRLVGPAGAVELEHAAIIAHRHIHIGDKLADRWGVAEKSLVSVRAGGERGVTFHNVLIRRQSLEFCVMHLDTEEGNAAGLKNGDLCEVVE